MWHTPPLPNQVEDYGGDKPHGRIVRNVRSVLGFFDFCSFSENIHISPSHRRFLTECRDPEERTRIIERMFLALPAASKQKDDDPEEEELERQKLAELRRISLAMRGELTEE